MHHKENVNNSRENLPETVRRSPSASVGACGALPECTSACTAIMPSNEWLACCSMRLRMSHCGLALHDGEYAQAHAAVTDIHTHTARCTQCGAWSSAEEGVTRDAGLDTGHQRMMEQAPSSAEEGVTRDAGLDPPHIACC